MRNLKFTNDAGQTWQQVSKRKARKLYDRGATIMICASNLHPFSAWHPAVYLDGRLGTGFDTMVYSYEIYNCIDSETGRYPVYYEEGI